MPQQPASRTLPAAAVPKGATVGVPRGPQLTVERVENATPIPGQITWTYRDGDGIERRYEISAATRVEILALP